MSGGSPRKPRVAVIGAGMAGILAAIRLAEEGYDDVVVYEKAARLGGTWRDNTYPGIACDVPAHLYSYSFAPNPDWSQMFAPGDEIEAYFERVARDYGVVGKIRFDEAVEACEFRDGRWHIGTSRGRGDVADFVIAATGVLHHPKIPDFDGLDEFAGACFHSARWDHDVPLDGRRVGVVGTGSTAVQITSALAPRVAALRLFQRTAQWIMPMENPVYTAAEKREFRERPEVLEALVAKFDRVMVDTIAEAVIDADSELMQNVERACLENLEHTVRDPALREALRPDYRAGCKRLIFSTDFYEAIQHPNARLVTAAIERIEPAGVRTADGELHELDVLVLATGFHPDRFIRPAVVRGRGGVDLDEVWAKRPLAYLSVSVPDMPNFFMLNGPNSPIGNFSLIRIAEFQMNYVLQLMGHVRDGACREVSASPEATAAFDAARVDAARSSIWTTGCNSWYLDAEGVPMSWPWSYHRFAEAMRSPDLDAYELVG
ncbi:MAG: flavin-containing monooxygenase [Gammaproteobacteria bacterium]